MPEQVIPAYRDPEFRRAHVGGSDAASITGRSKWKTEFVLFMEKMGKIPPDDISDNPPVYWGTRLEDMVAEEFTLRTGKKTRRRRATMYHVEHPWMTAHLDRIVEGERAFLECKTANQFMAHDWGDEGTDEIPGYYRDQVDHYLNVTGYERAYVAVLIGGQDFRWYVIERDQQRLDELIAQEVEFHSRLSDNVPPPMVAETDANMAYPVSFEDTAFADVEEFEAISRLAEIAATEKALKAEAEPLRALVKKCLGDKAILAAPDGTPLATWRTMVSRRFDRKSFAADHPQLEESYTKTATSRTFRLKHKEDADVQ